MNEGVRAQLRERQLPPGCPVMFQTWRDLIFLHWRVPADLVTARLPRGLELDTYEGSAWIGVVPFFMRRVRGPALASAFQFPRAEFANLCA